MVIKPSDMKNILENGSLKFNSPSLNLNAFNTAFPHHVLYDDVSVNVGPNILFKALTDAVIKPAKANCGKNQGNSLNVALYPPSPICLNNLLFVELYNQGRVVGCVISLYSIKHPAPGRG